MFAHSHHVVMHYDDDGDCSVHITRDVEKERLCEKKEI